MKTLITAAAAAFLLGTPLALAANTTGTTASTTPTKPMTQTATATSLSGKCMSLGTQFDKAEMQHKSDKNYKQALALRSEGKSLCTSHKQTAGIKKIESALTMIGVKPNVKG